MIDELVFLCVDASESVDEDVVEYVEYDSRLRRTLRKWMLL